ncbi:MAG: leucyl aminopeptidase [Bacteroidota bacterium]
MKVSLSSNKPKDISSPLGVFLLSAHNHQQLKTDFPEIGDVQEKWQKAGKHHILSTQGGMLLIVGMGEEFEAEAIRKAMHNIYQQATTLNQPKVSIMGIPTEGSFYLAASEALFLSAYQFDIYKSEKPEPVTQEIIFIGDEDLFSEIEKGRKIAEATCIARDLVNEPVITLTAVELASRIEQLGEEFGFDVDVLQMSKIQSLKMGGLLAVNMGSEIPPTFSIMTYKHPEATNQQAVVLVGKGVVYDTGGLSLKPTANSMDFMKADMGGAAAVIGAFCAVASLKLKINLIGLVPATDNRPGKNAYTPGDVIKMFDESTVEVLNTDAEGRMLLADALAYAKKYDPELVIDLATLTGAKVVAIGSTGIGMMSTASEEVKNRFKQAGEDVYERLVEFPLWKEYRDMLNSDIADLKNIGGREAGSITAGKFLEHFTDYPWIHLDIAGSAFSHSRDSYRGKNGTGVGVRLLTQFLANY